MTVQVLSTMEFGREWLEAVAGDDTRVEILEIPAERAEELPGAVLREVEVMYTNLAFPSPKQAPGCGGCNSTPQGPTTSGAPRSGRTGP